MNFGFKFSRLLPRILHRGSIQLSDLKVDAFTI